jgi:signal peptidase II
VRGRALVIPLVAAAVFVLDQVSKYLVATYLVLNEPWYVVPFLRPIFALTYIRNTGAAFGIFQNQNLFFSIVAIIVIIVILVYVRSTPRPELLVAFSLGLQLGGAFGNLVDRLRHGYVIDFLHLNFWAISNVADMSISLGVVLLGYFMIFKAQPPAAVEQASAPVLPEARAGDHPQTESGQHDAV